MDDGALTESTQQVASAVQDKNEPTRKSLWERLKPLWWLRGVLGALALIGFLDQIGWVREKWLPLVHAIATRWSEGIAWLSASVSAVLPFDFEITSWEGHYLTVIFALILPAMVPAVRILLRPPLGRFETFVVALFAVVVGNIVLASLLSGQTILISDFAPVAVPLLLMVSATAVLVSSKTNPAYFRSLATTVIFLATLEVIYVAPQVQEMLQPVFDWIAPSDLS